MTRIHRIFFSGTQAKQHCNTCTNCLVCAGYDLIEWLMDRLCIEDSRKLLLTQHRAGVGSIYSINVCSSRGCPPGQPALPVRLLLPRQRAEEPPGQGRQLPLQIPGSSCSQFYALTLISGVLVLKHEALLPSRLAHLQNYLPLQPLTSNYEAELLSSFKPSVDFLQSASSARQSVTR